MKPALLLPVLSAAMAVILHSMTATAADIASCDDKGDGWDAVEQYIWHQACNDQIADLSGQTSREVSPDFLRVLLRTPRYRDGIAPRGLYLENAVITGDLDLSNLQLKYGVLIEESEFRGNLKLYGLMTDDQVSFYRSQIHGNADLSYISTRVDVGFEGATIDKGLKLHNAHIGRRLVLNHAEV